MQKRKVAVLDKPVCLCLRFESHPILKTYYVRSWLNLCLLRIGLCPTCNFNYKWLCTACSRRRQQCLCFKSLSWPPMTTPLGPSCNHAFVSGDCYDQLAVLIFCFSNPTCLPNPLFGKLLLLNYKIPYLTHVQGWSLDHLLQGEKADVQE